jgi:hypothetical protein
MGKKWWRTRCVELSDPRCIKCKKILKLHHTPPFCTQRCASDWAREDLVHLDLWCAVCRTWNDKKHEINQYRKDRYECS